MDRRGAHQVNDSGTAAEPLTSCAAPAAPLAAQSLDDFRLSQRVDRALRATGYAPLRGIQVIVDGDRVTLVGRVPSYFMKQVAQTTALAVTRTHQVCNDLDVTRPC
jgi:osmotically-inducible protein OsmY